MEKRTLHFYKHSLKEGNNEKIAIIIVALAMTSCTKYKLHFGKACTPDNREWSYVWFMEKDGTVNVSKENCKV